MPIRRNVPERDPRDIAFLVNVGQENDLCIHPSADWPASVCKALQDIVTERVCVDRKRGRANDSHVWYVVQTDQSTLRFHCHHSRCRKKSQSS
jgi:hypothetical protein